MRVRRQGRSMTGQLKHSPLAAGGCLTPAFKALILNPVKRRFPPHPHTILWVTIGTKDVAQV